MKISFDGYRFPPEIIQQAIWLYVRFTLSFHDIEDLMAECGIAVSYVNRHPILTPDRRPILTPLLRVPGW
jgi:hypothetical protein